MTLSILLVVGSLALIIMEVLFVSFGALALGATALGVGGVVTAFSVSQMFGWIMAAVLLVGVPFCLKVAFTVLPKLGFARGFYLEAPEMTDAERQAGARIDKKLLGREGLATSPLRPAGIATFGEEVLQVVSQGVMIEPGARVRVVELTGNRIVVEEI